MSSIYLYGRASIQNPEALKIVRLIKQIKWLQEKVVASLVSN